MPNLATYLASRKISQTAFAETIGKDRVTVWRLVHRKHTPDPETMRLILAASGGEVDFNSWAPVADDAAGGQSVATQQAPLSGCEDKVSRRQQGLDRQQGVPKTRAAVARGAA